MIAYGGGLPPTPPLELCDACGVRPAGHGHFALYCAPCSELPHGASAPLEA